MADPQSPFTVLAGNPKPHSRTRAVALRAAHALPRQALSGVLAVPMMTAADPAHQHAVESYLRPLLVALGARVGAPGLSVLEAQFSLLDPVLTAWSDEVVPALSGTLGRLARV